MLTTALVLGYSSSDAGFIYDCDCSSYGMGAVLSHKQDGVERVISYYSKSFTKVERNYCVTRQEIFTVVSSVKHYHHYLYSAKFTIRTDHSALRWLLKTLKNPEGQVSRWIEVLSAYNFSIEQRAGKLHGNCDGLSRIPCNVCPCCKRLEEKEMQNSSEGNCACKAQAVEPDLFKVKEGISRSSEPNSSLSPCFIEQTQAQSQSVPYRRVNTRSQTDSCTEMRTWLDTKCADDIKFEQNRNPKISSVITWKNEACERPVWERVSHLDTDYKSYWTQWKRLFIKDGILYHKWICKTTGRDHFELEYVDLESLYVYLANVMHDLALHTVLDSENHQMKVVLTTKCRRLSPKWNNIESSKQTIKILNWPIFCKLSKW